MQYLPLIALLVIVVLFFSYAGRQRRKQAETLRVAAEGIGVGTRVMTTSGLHGTVVAKNPEDDTVTLSIAPNVEVTWEIAALRDLSAMPDRLP